MQKRGSNLIYPCMFPHAETYLPGWLRDTSFGVSGHGVIKTSKGDWQLFSHDHHIDNAHMIILDLPQN